ncbi:MAG TPA: hypothetical protein VFU56_01680 [Gaiellaceae bacterium]|nr:hypothetical protein [Gaiellaceae bacterium]
MAEDELRQFQEQLAALDVGDFVVSAASTLATLATAKLEAGDLPQAKQAIDALGSLLPHVEGELAAELKAALASLQVAFARAASA